ncbi:COG4223 family protein [Phenylobacterium sp.]|uniref:COG4223 family protein n=1 Tax=Phenylobacterium sp. TaxID=1871053 RepID=UPI002FDDA9A3
MTETPPPPPSRSPTLAGRFFWALLAFAAAVAIAVAAFIRFGPRLPAPLDFGPSSPPAAEAPAAPSPAPVAVDAPAPAQVPAVPAADLARLEARLDDLEAGRSRTAASARSALAAAALLSAAQTSRPFTSELAAVEALAPADLDLSGFAAMASTGAPSRATLALEFPDFAARAAAAARQPSETAPLGERLLAGLSRVILVRPVGRLSGDAPEARLARAEVQLNEGDLEAALASLAGLPPAAQAALAPWWDRAQARARLDRQAAALGERALRDLARLEEAAP